VDGTGLGSCPLEGFGITGVEPSSSAARELVRWILWKWAVRMGGGSNWLRIVSSCGLWYWQCSAFGSDYQRVSFQVIFICRECVVSRVVLCKLTLFSVFPCNF
jgi:hypothetical protein